MRLYESPVSAAKNGKKKTTKGFVESLKKAVGVVRETWQRTAFETKAEFRQFFFSSDVSQARVVIVLLALTIALFLISDYMFFGFSLVFYALVALRIGLVAYCGYQFAHVEGVQNFRSYDRSMLLYLMVISGSILLVNATRPQNFLPHIIVLDVAIFVYYLVLPTRFSFQFLPSVFFSLGEVALIVVTYQSFMAPALFTALLSLFFANVVAALASLQLHSYRWRIFQSFLERKETERLVTIGQTAGMIGHDIRNPLQAIVSELYLAKDTISSYPEPARREALESIELIEQQTEYISKIISDLQDFARPINPQYETVNLPDVITSVFQTINVPDTVQLHIDVEGLPQIRTDPTLIRRAITNLVNNAIQAMPEGGKLELIAHQANRRAIISVSDTGKGIPPEIRARLFTPLVTTKAKGQGFGLAVVKRLVEALGGEITFESTAGKGTTFVMSLPLAQG